MPLDECELTVHIGGAKCGSSAIQAFLRQNASALAARGIAIPGEALDFFTSLFGYDLAKDDDR